MKLKQKMVCVWMSATHHSRLKSPFTGVIKQEEISYGIMIMYASILFFFFVFSFLNKFVLNFQKKMMLVHGQHSRCMESDISARKVYITQCKPKSDDQKWIIENFNSRYTNWSLTF